MITIIAHGIMGTAYQQNIIVDDGVIVKGDLKVFHDIRHHLSMRCDDGTPATGWALSPAPSGIWLSRVERAFDVNYSPAYLMVSFLIPCGQRLKDDTVLNKISRAMILNHSKFINQNVIQYECDWSFLNPLAEELEGCLVSDDGVVWNYTNQTDGDVAIAEKQEEIVRKTGISQGPDSANLDRYGKVRRGGYYLQSEHYPRITYRKRTLPSERHEWLGFRHALSL